MKHERAYFIEFLEAIRLFIEDVPLIPIENLQFVLNRPLKIKSNERTNEERQTQRGMMEQWKRNIVFENVHMKIIRRTLFPLY